MKFSRIAFFLTFLLIYIGESVAQELIWERVESGFPADVRIDSSDDVIVATQSPGQILKYSEQGELIWKIQDSVQSAEAIAVDPWQNIVRVSGISAVRKLNKDGQVLWDIQLRDISSHLYDVDCDSDGNIYISGQNYGIIVVKLSSDGDVLWSHEENHWGWGKSCKVDPWGDVIVSGVDQGQYWQDYNWKIMKFNHNGEKAWERIEGSPASDNIRSSTIDKFGNIYVGGDWLAKYDVYGNLMWFDPVGLSMIRTVATDGVEALFVGVKEISQSSKIVKCDLDGGILWQIESVGAPNGYIETIACAGSNHIGVVSSVGDSPSTVTGYYTVGEVEAEVLYDAPPSLSIFPNPVNDSIVYFRTGKRKESWTVKIYDVKGRLVHSLDGMDEGGTWNCRDISNEQVSPGVYIGKLILGGTPIALSEIIITE